MKFKIATCVSKNIEEPVVLSLEDGGDGDVALVVTQGDRLETLLWVESSGSILRNSCSHDLLKSMGFVMDDEDKVSSN